MSRTLIALCLAAGLSGLSGLGGVAAAGEAVTAPGQSSAAAKPQQSLPEGGTAQTAAQPKAGTLSSMRGIGPGCHRGKSHQANAEPVEKIL